MSSSRKPETGTWPGGISIIEADDSPVTTSGSGMTTRKRPAPLGEALDPDVLVAPAEAWALGVLQRARIKPDGKVNGTADTQENYAQRFVYYIRSIRGKIGRGDSDGAVADALVLGGFVREAQLKFRWEDTALTGQKFVAGRKPGTGGPIRKAIAKLLKRNPAMKNAALWVAVSDSPPKGWDFSDNRLGKYATGPDGANMDYRRFCNVAWEERKKLKA